MHSDRDEKKKHCEYNQEKDIRAAPLERDKYFERGDTG